MEKIQVATTAFIAILGVLLSIALSAQQAADPGVLLRAAIEKEEVDGDLQGAIVLYRQIIEKHGNNAAVAAKALYRLGWCHERLGNQEARNAYRRLIDAYPGQKEQVALARARLAELDATAGEASRKPTFRKIRIPANPGNGVLSPDGRKFAFALQGSVWLVPIPGNVQPDLAGEPVRLTEPMGAWNEGNTMAWSPDGNELAYTAADRLMAVSLKSGQTREIQTGVLERGVADFYIDWSPDGSKLAFSATHGGDEELWLMGDFLKMGVRSGKFDFLGIK